MMRGVNNMGDKKTEETINNILYESKAVPVILIMCGIISIFLGLTAFENTFFVVNTPRDDSSILSIIFFQIFFFR
jgi:hypothetical protein